MTALLDEQAILYQALGTPLGLVVAVTNFPLAQQKLYRARREADDPALAVLQFRRSPHSPEEEIWIVKGSPPTPKTVQVPPDDEDLPIA